MKIVTDKVKDIAEWFGVSEKFVVDVATEGDIGTYRTKGGFGPLHVDADRFDLASLYEVLTETLNDIHDARAEREAAENDRFAIMYAQRHI